VKVEFKPLTKEEYIAKRTGKIPAKVKRALRAEVRKIVGKVAKDAKRNLSRKRTGLLEKSLGATVTTASDEKTVSRAGAKSGFRLELSTDFSKRKLKYKGTTEGGKSVKLGAIRQDFKVFVQKGKKKGERKTINPTKYAHLIELGHAKGKGKGAARPFPFIGPAGKIANQTAPAELQKAIREAAKTE